MLRDSRDILANARPDAPDLAEGTRAPSGAQDPRDDAAMAAALAEFAADTRIPSVALVTIAELLTRIYGSDQPGPSPGPSNNPSMEPT